MRADGIAQLESRPDTRERDQRVACRRSPASTAARRASVPASTGTSTSSARSRRGAVARSSTRDAPSAARSRYSASTSAACRIHCSATLRGAVDQRRRVTRPAPGAPPRATSDATARRSPRSAASRDASDQQPRRTHVRVPSHARPGRALHVPLGQRRAPARRQRSRPSPGCRPRSTSARASVAAGASRRPGARSCTVGTSARSPSREATRATNAPGSPLTDAAIDCGHAATAASGIRRHPQRRRQVVGRQRLERVRGRARPSAPDDVEHDRAGRRRRRPAAPAAAPGPGDRPCATRPARAARAARTRRAAPATTWAGRRGAARPTRARRPAPGT